MGVVTWETLEKWIQAGRGQGTFDAYLPWLWIHRKNVSGLGNQVHDPMPLYRRASHFMALVEWHLALLCLYLGALDVREQFPLWPQPHLHPLTHYGPTPERPHASCRGLMSIAAELDVEHGRQVGSDAPYIATIDLLVTVRRRAGVGLAGLALKPHELIFSAEPTDRIDERLRMERACMRDYAATHKVVDRSLLGHSTGGVLELLSSGARLPQGLQADSTQKEFFDRFMDTAPVTSISAGIARTAARMSIDRFSANLLWRHLAWRRIIQIDITAPLEMGEPLRVGGVATANEIARELFGEVLN